MTTTTKSLDAGLARTVYSEPLPSRPDWLDSDPAFWARVEIGAADACWRWQGPKNADGYGTCSHGSAHRHAWRLANGEIPQKMYVLHSCDCRDCVNPAHLMAGDQSLNMKQKFQRGRHTDFTRKLRGRDVAHMRELASEGVGYAKIAELYQITPGHARNCLNGHKWPGETVDENQFAFEFHRGAP